MTVRPIGLALLAGLCVVGADWDARQTAAYMDARQKEWAAWPAAQLGNGMACLSCHTGMTYLLARPVLRATLGETQPTAHEATLLEGLRSRVGRSTGGELAARYEKEPRASQSIGVESVLAAFLLSRADQGRAELSAQTAQAFDRLWKLQKKEGDRKGSWSWFELDDDPYEGTASPFFGATLAAVAVGTTPMDYQRNAAEPVAMLREYLKANVASQPLHNRLLLAWAARRLPGVLTSAEQKAIIAEAFGKQESDGGWTLAALGPWPEHAAAKPSFGSDGYATALTAFTLQQAGVYGSDKKLKAALAWLRTHQDRQTGTWAAQSMNKVYPAGSMQENFMRDAATAFAVLALAGAEHQQGARSSSAGE